VSVTVPTENDPADTVVGLRVKADSAGLPEGLTVNWPVVVLDPYATEIVTVVSATTADVVTVNWARPLAPSVTLAGTAATDGLELVTVTVRGIPGLPLNKAVAAEVPPPMRLDGLRDTEKTTRLTMYIELVTLLMWSLAVNCSRSWHSDAGADVALAITSVQVAPAGTMAVVGTTTVAFPLTLSPTEYPPSGAGPSRDTRTLKGWPTSG
jgi:hypothetical protein